MFIGGENLDWPWQQQTGLRDECVHSQSRKSTMDPFPFCVQRPDVCLTWPSFHLRTRRSTKLRERSVIEPARHRGLPPSKHDTLNQCWFNVGPASATLAQHYSSIGSMCRVFWAGTIYLLETSSDESRGHLVISQGRMSDTVIYRGPMSV